MEKYIKLKKLVRELPEDEVRSFLYHVFMRLEMAEEHSMNKEQSFEYLLRFYQDFLRFKEGQTLPVLPFHAVHICFGDSIGGSLYAAFNETGSIRQQKIITVPALLSVGPVWNLHEESGIGNRQEWIEERFLFENDEDREMEKHRLIEALAEINSIPEKTPVWIWAGDNAHEQAGLRLSLYLLKDKNHYIRHLNPNKLFQPIKEGNFELLHSGELIPEKLIRMYENNQTLAPLTDEERWNYATEWAELAKSTGSLRLWSNGEFQFAEEDCYDALLLEAVEKLHAEDPQTLFHKSARVIGEVFGSLDQYIGDSFLEYRLRQLIYTGHLDIKGVPQAMRLYSVRRRERRASRIGQ
ncbi:DUF1835 domain-containing protein [Metabacillus sp. 84]|uniref:DUF1835 domain-containing protein n=1 Tax=Metabacillus sp. 84 TaxID=3404705 RepID=UPI003CF11057